MYAAENNKMLRIKLPSINKNAFFAWNLFDIVRARINMS